MGEGIQARRRALVVPREHGAWGILLGPLATGAAVGVSAGGDASGLAPLCLATLALFWLRTPVESWIGASPVRARTAEELRLVRMAAVGIGACAAQNHSLEAPLIATMAYLPLSCSRTVCQ